MSANSTPLPRTGTDTPNLLAIGLGLVAVGATCVVVTRRRPS